MIKSGGYDWWETDAGGEDVESGGGEKAWLSKKPCNPPVTPFRKVSETTRKKEIKKERSDVHFSSERMGFCSRKKRTRTTCFHTRAVLCVGHFGSAVTILDKRVVSWRAKMEVGFFPARQSTRLASGVGASAGCWWGGEVWCGLVKEEGGRLGVREGGRLLTSQRLTPCRVKPYNNSIWGLLVFFSFPTWSNYLAT